MAINTVSESPRVLRDSTTFYNMAEVETAIVIQAGNFVCYKSGSNEFVVNPSDVADAGTDTQNREAYADLFAGIALDTTRDGEVEDIRVAIAPSQFFLLLESAAAVNALDLIEIFADADSALTPNNTVVAGTSSQIAYVTKANADTNNRIILCQLLPSAIIRALEQS